MYVFGTHAHADGARGETAHGGQGEQQAQRRRRVDGFGAAGEQRGDQAVLDGHLHALGGAGGKFAAFLHGLELIEAGAAGGKGTLA